MPVSATLGEILLAPEVTPSVIADCCALIEQEVGDKSGASGAAIKVAFKTVTSFAPGYYRGRVADLLPQFVAALEPFWQDFGASGGPGFGEYLVKRGDEVAQAMLAVTDAEAEKSGRPVIVKAYRAVRGNAAHHIEAALPRVGDLVAKYAG